MLLLSLDICDLQCHTVHRFWSWSGFTIGLQSSIYWKIFRKNKYRIFCFGLLYNRFYFIVQYIGATIYCCTAQTCLKLNLEECIYTISDGLFDEEVLETKMMKFLYPSTVCGRLLLWTNKILQPTAWVLVIDTYWLSTGKSMMWLHLNIASVTSLMHLLKLVSSN